MRDLGASIVVGLLLAVVGSGCGLWHNGRRFLHPAEYVVTDELPSAEVGAVSYASGWRDDGPGPYDPERTDVGTRPVDLSPGGWVKVEPVAADAELRLWVRRTGVVQQGFAQVLTVTGARSKELPLEVRPVAGPLHGESRTLAVGDLANVYNDYRFEDGDLLLVEVRSDEQRAVERYWFRHREVGLRAKGVAGVLLRVPIPWGDQGWGSPSPALAAGVALGWRPRTRHWQVRWLFDQVAVVSTVAIGSTAFDAVVGSDGLDDQVTGAFNAGLAGGGVEAFDFLSLQILANVSSLFRDANETPATLAIGIDAVPFAVFVRDATTRLLYPNRLSAPPE